MAKLAVLWCVGAFMVPRIRVCRIRRPSLNDDELLRDPGEAQHDYVRGRDNNQPVDESKVSALLSKRVAAQLAGEYDEADALRTELRKVHSVDVVDRNLEWYVRDRWHNYVRAEDDEGSIDLELIDEMLTRRTLAKRERDFDTADAIRNKLRDMNVRVDDFARTWSTTYGRQTKLETHDYERDDDDDTDVDLVKVNELLLKRLEAKFQRKFDVADSIRDELDQMGVRVDDVERTWRAGLPSRNKAAQHDYVRVPGGEDEVEVDEVEVSQLLLERLQAKRRRDFPVADELRRQLTKMGVRIDDSKRTWSTAPQRRGMLTIKPYTRIESREENLRGEPLDIDSTYVNEFIEARVRARINKEYQKADDMLKDLWLMGVQVNDRDQTWRTVSNYTYVGKPESLEGADMEAIEKLIGKRRILKSQGVYEESDAVRQTLLTEHNVRLHDATRTWTFGRDSSKDLQESDETTDDLQADLQESDETTDDLQAQDVDELQVEEEEVIDDPEDMPDPADEVAPEAASPP